MLDAASRHGFTLTPLEAKDGVEGQEALKALAGAGQYFQAFLPDGSRLVHAISRCADGPAARALAARSMLRTACPSITLCVPEQLHPDE